MATLTADEVTVLRERLIVLERRVEVVERARHARPTFADGLVGALTDSPGLVTDEGVARATPCECLELGDGSEECYSKGVVGALDAGQKALFCNPRLARPASPEQRERVAVYQDCGRQVKALPNGERLLPFFSCIDHEQRARGIEATA